MGVLGDFKCVNCKYTLFVPVGALNKGEFQHRFFQCARCESAYSIVIGEDGEPYVKESAGFLIMR